MAGAGGRLITIFSIPKPFTGEIEAIQRRALASWLALGARVLLFGDEQGVAAAAAELGAEHAPEVARNEHGTPLLDGVFAAVRDGYSTPLLAFVNADIVLLDDFRRAVERVASEGRPFLLVGESWDTPVPAAPLAGGVARLPGQRRGAGALDYFAFSRDLFREVPPFAVGRVGFDNWLVWKARDAGALVVDASPSVRAIHQSHGYAHVAGGFDETRSGAEAAANWALIGDKSRVYTRYDATHVLTRRGLRRNLGATLRAKERARKAVWKLRHGQLRPARFPR